jgi:GAF domain-containing protein
MAQIVSSPITISSTYQQQLIDLLNDSARREQTHLATLQLYDEKSQYLYLIAQKGFSSRFVDYFKQVRAFDPSSCGRAFGIGAPVIINDTSKDIAFNSLCIVTDKEGFRSVKSEPIIAEGKKKLGVVSTHYEQPRYKWDLQLLAPVLKELAQVLTAIRSESKARPSFQ